MKLNSITVAFGFVGSFFSWMFGGWDSLIQYLLLFMMADYVTGMIKAGINKEICNKIGFIGLAKKVGILAIVAVAHGLDQLFATEEANLFSFNFPIIRTIVIWGYIINEVTSILENVKMMGVPVPSIIQKVLSILKAENNKINKK